MEINEASANNENSSYGSENSGSSDNEKNDCSTLGHSLIKFMSLATGRVKTALQKPANYKKNINHRRYLQKQLKICTRRKKRHGKTKAGSKTKATSVEETTGLKSPAQVYLNQKLYGQDVEVYQNLFFQAQNTLAASSCWPMVEGSFPGFANGSLTQSEYFAPNTTLPAQNIHGLSETASWPAYHDDLLPDVLDETEHFLTGEELTRTLDIKDLFVPGQSQQFEDIAPELSYSPIDESCTHNTFQTIPSTANILSW